MCLSVCVSGHFNRFLRGLVRNKKNKSSANDFDDDRSGSVNPRYKGVLLNESPGQ